MGLLQKLETDGSTFSTNNGGDVATIPGGPFLGPNITNLSLTNNSGLHANAAGDAGYSLTGAPVNNVVQNYASYNDGVTNPLPSPSTLDLQGEIPFNNYADNAPENVTFI